MRITCAIMLISIFAAAPFSFAGGLQVRQVVHIPDSNPPAVELTIAWANAWRNDRNHDAAWIVLRQTAAPRRLPLRLARTGHVKTHGDVEPQITISEDGLGAFIAPASAHRGDVQWTLRLALADTSPAGAIEAWAVEMVHIPAGGYELGDGHPAAVEKGAFFRVGDDGKPAGPITISDERAIDIASTPGSLFYSVGNVPEYQGDQKGPIPEAFPKGTRAFYIMKYELTQGEYARFLNAMPTDWRTERMPSFDEQKEANTSSIALEGGQCIATSPRRPLNFVTWDDTAAFADWMCLRPMTEFEFEKAARGPKRPMPGDFPWGSASRNGVERVVQPMRDLAVASDQDESELTDAARVKLAASPYWVMDLAGSMWERVVSAGHPVGRAFAGSHGDGVLSANGDATNADWPRGDGDSEEVNGIGYRGGAEYFAAPDSTNPFSMVAVRTYAAWNGAYGSKTYAARACRNAP